MVECRSPNKADIKAAGGSANKSPQLDFASLPTASNGGAAGGLGATAVPKGHADGDDDSQLQEVCAWVHKIFL